MIFGLIRSPFPDRVAFAVGPLAIHWYGIVIALGVIAGFQIALREAKRRSLDTVVLSDIVLWCGIAGIIGARVYYVVLNATTYSNNLSEVFAIWHGGLAIHGALLGGALGFLLYVRHKKLHHVWSYLDCTALGVVTGQIIGRWGNFINQEAFGRPTDLPWGMYIEPQYRPPVYASFTTFHPTFLYESLWNLVVLIILLVLNRMGKLKTGQTVALYLVFYSIGRFFIEGLRTDSLMLGSIRAAQLMSIVLFCIGILMYQHFSHTRSWVQKLFPFFKK